MRARGVARSVECGGTYLSWRRARAVNHGSHCSIAAATFKEKKAARFATIIDFCEFLVIDSIARGTQRLNCSMRGSMAMELHIEQLSR